MYGRDGKQVREVEVSRSTHHAQNSRNTQRTQHAKLQQYAAHTAPKTTFNTQQTRSTNHWYNAAKSAHIQLMQLPCPEMSVQQRSLTNR